MENRWAARVSPVVRTESVAVSLGQRYGYLYYRPKHAAAWLPM